MKYLKLLVEPQTQEIQNPKEEQRYFLIYLLYMKANLNQEQRQKQSHKILFLQIIHKRKNHKGGLEEYKVQLISK